MIEDGERQDHPEDEEKAVEFERQSKELYADYWEWMGGEDTSDIGLAGRDLAYLVLDRAGGLRGGY